MLEVNARVFVRAGKGLDDKLEAWAERAAIQQEGAST